MNINILEKMEMGNQLRFQFPMIICAIGVISIQRKLIWNTLKVGWSFQSGSEEKIRFLKMFGLGILVFLFSGLIGKERIKLEEKQRAETEARMLKEEVFTAEELEKIKQKEVKRHAGKKPVPLPFYNISPLFCFIMAVIIAPIAEECVFRYLIFEIFDKNNPLAYIFSALSFIFLHGGGGILNFAAIKILLLSYLPMTIFFIYVYKKSKWNMTYPIFYHFLGNFTVFTLVAI